MDELLVVMCFYLGCGLCSLPACTGSFVPWLLLPWDRGSSFGVPEELGKKQVLVA